MSGAEDRRSRRFKNPPVTGDLSGFSSSSSFLSDFWTFWVMWHARRTADVATSASMAY